MNTYILLSVGFLAALAIASTYSFSLIKYSKDDLEEFLRDIKVCEMNPYSTIIKTYHLPPMSIQDGRIILLRNVRWQIIYPQQNNTIYAPTTSSLTYIRGYVRLNLTSIYLNDHIVVLVSRV